MWAPRSCGSLRLAIAAAAIATLVFMSACACGPAGEHAPHVDAWPIVRYWTQPDRKERHAEVAWPLFEWHDAPSGAGFYARPLYNRRVDRDSRITESEWLWPIGSGTRRPDLVRTVTYPLSLSETEIIGDGAKRRQFILLPLVVYRGGAGPTDFLLFPLGGVLHNFLGHEKILIVLWPLYVYQEQPPARRWSVLHPVFTRVRYEEGGGGFKVWPLFGWTAQPGRGSKMFILWPFFQRELSKTEQGDFRRWFFFPFYGRIDEPRGQARTILWPFFGWRRDDNEGQQTWWYPWPFLGHRAGHGVAGRTFWPIYEWERRPERYYSEFLWPLGWYRSESNEQTWKWSLRLVPLFFVEREGTREVHQAQATAAARRTRTGAWQAWPVVKWRSEAAGDEHLEFPSVWPFRYHAEFERNLGPFFRLVEYERTPDNVRSLRVLWRLLRVDTWPEGRYFEAGPLFRLGWEHGRPRRVYWSVLGGFVGCSAAETRGRYWRLLYLLRFGPAGSANVGDTQ